MKKDPFIFWLQTRLVAHGWKIDTDGVQGGETNGAMMAFQRKKKLPVTGVADVDTIEALRAAPASAGPDVPVVKPPKTSLQGQYPWMALAYQKKGLRETDPALKEFLKSDKGQPRLGDPSKIPWCGDLVQTIIALTVPGEAFPINPFLARNWLKFGVPVDPCYGSILVFSRPGSSFSGHVGCYVGETKTHYKVLGGNQSNAITDGALIQKGRLLGARMPKTYKDAPRVKVNASGGVISTNEA